MNNQEKADAYDRAADYIEANGWCRNRLSMPSGEVCIVGATGVAVNPQLVLDHAPVAWGQPAWGEIEHDRQDWYILNLGLDEFIPEDAPYLAIVNWNNMVAKDKFEVIDLLRHAAKEVRDRE